MQWLLLAITFIITALLQRLARASGVAIPVEARATLSLGLLLLAAYIGGSLARRFRLPRVAGYFVVGWIAGPGWLNFVRLDELQVLHVISSGALALIAFGAGTQLRLTTFRDPSRRALWRVIAGAMAVPFLVVTLVTLSVSPWFPLTAHQPFRDALVVALVLGVFATVAAPAITWSVIQDVGARGRGALARGLMDVTIVQALIAAVGLIVILAIARPLASGGAVVPGSAVRATLVLAGSLASGVALAFVLLQYLRIASGAMRVWVLIGFAFIIAQIVRLAGLDAVLMGLAAGCIVRNVTPHEAERLDGELERCAVPVNVVFFALAGAALDVSPLDELRLWPWAILLIALRINGLRWGLQIAGRWPRQREGIDPPVGAEMSRYGWLGLVSQGGMAMTFAAVLRSAFPEWNVSLEALLVAMIGFHMLIGPICFQWALRRTHEVTDARGEVDVPQTAVVTDGDNLVSRV